MRIGCFQAGVSPAMRGIIMPRASWKRQLWKARSEEPPVLKRELGSGDEDSFSFFMTAPPIEPDFWGSSHLTSGLQVTWDPWNTWAPSDP